MDESSLIDDPQIDEPKEKKPEPFNIYHYDSQLAFAFQTDCEEFLNKFSNLESYSFSSFANLWKETYFISIFESQEHLLMLKTFIQNCFIVVKSFLFSKNLYTQVGAIYTLYALYYKQPVKEWVKIRLTQSETDKFSDIVAFHKRHGNLDVVFVFNKMRLDAAFQFCALQEPLNLNPRYPQRCDDVKIDNKRKKKPIAADPLKKFKSLMEDDSIVQDLEKTDSEYQNLASKYRDKCNQLYVFPSTITAQLKKAYEDVVDENQETEAVTEPLQEIKKRAMTNTRATYRAERKVITALDGACSK